MWEIITHIVDMEKFPTQYVFVWKKITRAHHDKFTDAALIKLRRSNMKKFSNITILLLSISFASAPVLARQSVDDYIGYTHSMNNPAEHMRHERSTDDTSICTSKAQCRYCC